MGMGFGFTTSSETPQPPDASSLPDVVTLANGQMQTYTLRTGSDYTVTETVPPAWLLASASCSNGSGTLSGSALSGIRVDADATVTCTFTDTPVPPRGTLVIRKVTDPHTGSDGHGIWVHDQQPDAAAAVCFEPAGRRDAGERRRRATRCDRARTTR